jgi:hypothetical protein
VGSCQLQNLGWGKALLAEGADREGIVALGEAIAMLVNEESGVKVSWGRKAQGALEQDLASGGFEEVAAADYFGDLGIGVIDYAGELVGREAGVFRMMAKGFAPDEEIAEIFAGDEGLLAEVSVYEGDCLAVGDSVAVIHPADCHSRCESREWTATTVVDGLYVNILVGCMHHGCEVFAAATTGVDVSGDEELVEGSAVQGKALGLIEDRWLPGDAEPCEVFEDSVGEVWP